MPSSYIYSKVPMLSFFKAFAVFSSICVSQADCAGTSSTHEVPQNGNNCSLEASISCTLHGSHHMSCNEIEPFDVTDCGKINNELGFFIVEYTFTYSNNNDEGDAIKLRSGTNKNGRNRTFATAQGEVVELNHLKISAGESVSITVQQYIEHCNFEMTDYEAFIQMKGRLIGKPRGPENRCFAEDSYKEKIIRYIVDSEYKEIP